MRWIVPRATASPLDTTRLVRSPAGADDHMVTRSFFSLTLITHNSFHHDLSNCICLTLVLSHTGSLTHLLLSLTASLSRCFSHTLLVLSHIASHLFYTATPLDFSSRFALFRSVLHCTFLLLVALVLWSLQCSSSRIETFVVSHLACLPLSVCLWHVTSYSCVLNSASSHTREHFRQSSVT